MARSHKTAIVQARRNAEAGTAQTRLRRQDSAQAQLEVFEKCGLSVLPTPPGYAGKVALDGDHTRGGQAGADSDGSRRGVHEDP
ncbi:hypothetical protein QM806_27670 [Rhodococcus sp. IEGM 1351]|uniref:hypothetical protein n=1 Tax=Rhodococcus sp. IEGM 1351 TaxID=3047089 RepID=UPI0022F332B4|nr:MULTISPECIES: hypothetical protein [Rhodococcus]MDI9939170.1 hypothetical protein [Rhodococcus sp. IEGM 1351]